jgi:hypothetical protein
MIQRKRSTLLTYCVAPIVVAWGCSTNDSGIQGRFGAPSSGGEAFVNDAGGGSTVTSGQPGTGGAIASGSDTGKGGNPGTGGSPGIDLGGRPGAGGNTTIGGRTGRGGNTTIGGRTGTGGSRGPGGKPGSGGTQSTGGSAGGSSGGTCSSTAPTGLEVGMLIPDVQLERCDGSPVSLHDLVCGKPLTQVYSYAGWCPGCRGFSGIEADGGSFMTGNSLYDKYHDKGYEQVIILSATSKFGQAPTAADCAELQALHEGLVVFDSTGKKTQDELGLKVNGGTGLVDSEGVWVVAPPVDDPQDGGLVAVFTELMSRFGFR